MTFDSSNPCLRLQKTKIGASPRVLTFDTFPVRTPKPEKGEFYNSFKYWTEYCDLAIEFQHEIAQYSKLRIVLGKQNWLLVQEHIEKQKDVVVTRVPLFIGSLRETVSFYSSPAELLVVQDKVMIVVKQIIIPSYHGEWLFYANSSNYMQARIMDITWNACAAIAGINTVNAGYFEWKVTAKQQKGRNPFIQRLVQIVAQEKRGIFRDEEKVKEEFSDWIYKNTKLLNPVKGSLARQILCELSAKGLETNAAGGYQNLVKAREARAQARAKALEIQAASGWQSLAKGHETQAASGYQSLVKAREVRAANWEKIANTKWQAIKDGPLKVWENSTKKADRTRADKF
jgi:hypothetical protein